MNDPEIDTIDILRDTVKEYRDLLNICYYFIMDKNPNDDKAENLLTKLHEYGIGDPTPKPIDKKDRMQ